MGNIGIYNQVTEFTTKNAGTAEWCKAELKGKLYFIKKFYTPVYPSKDIGISKRMYDAGVEEYHRASSLRKEIYKRLSQSDQSGILVVPIQVMTYQFHICTVAEFVTANLKPEQVHLLSEWQRLVLMRTLTLALMNVHTAGVVHSDMKPDNLLIVQDGEGNCRLRLIDFDGSFLESDPPTDPEDVAGDPAFFSPEAYQMGEDETVRLDHRIDLFALGIIFHYLWTGKLPDKPADHTIGECVVKGESVKLDESIPLVLQQVIQRLISKDPDNRLPLKKVYDILGVQIGLHPEKIVQLQTKEKEQKSVPKPETKEKTAEIAIRFVDEDSGRVLREKKISLPYDSRRILEAEEITGYHVSGLKTKEVRVSAKGYADSPVEFTYKKNAVKKKEKGGTLRKLVIAALVLFCVYVMIMFYAAEAAISDGLYRQAREYMNAIPFYEEFFQERYDLASVGTRYSNAVTQYRSGNYDRAKNVFEDILKGSYRRDFPKTGLYISFCEAHLGNPADYYAEIVDNLSFEDAKSLLTFNTEIFGKYALGNWSYSDGDTARTMNMDEQRRISGWPERPSDGVYTISNGKFMFKAEGASEYVSLFRIEVYSKTRFSFYSIKTGKTYTFTKKS